MIKEDLLHYLWRTKNFNHDSLQTTDYKPLKIINYGFLNPSDGPDFLDAKVEIDNVIWNGAIEIHINSSDWAMHGHSEDDNYKRTILHVVYNADKDIAISEGENLQCLELKNRISRPIIQLYKDFNNDKWIPCESLIHKASDFAVFSAKEKALSDRLSRRWQEVNTLNTEAENDWEEFGYQLLCRAFGLVHNAEAFQEIARLIPLNVVKKNGDSIEILEALFFGTAGMLDADYKDEYPNRLKKNYAFLNKKYTLDKKIHTGIKHKAVRPQNFPLISLSQFANLISELGIISKLMNGDKKEIISLLDISASPYWNNHYTFDKISTTRKKALGINRKRTIIINAIVPILYYFGKKYKEEEKIKKSIELLESLPSEKNSIVNRWKELNVKMESAYDSQALLELKKNYCNHKLCLSCAIGHDILKIK